jgi:hypothetical protein
LIMVSWRVGVAHDENADEQGQAATRVEELLYVSSPPPRRMWAARFVGTPLAAVQRGQAATHSFVG